MSSNPIGERRRVKLGRFAGVVGTIDARDRMGRYRLLFDEPRAIGRHLYSSAWFHGTSLEVIA